ncbi:MAG: nucleoside triphosphate pyrophosphohydrolase [Victivallales bacterium]|jgi:MazG family protein|nr:nucleoside triphosphate pyrophosphohydrolase [Victivallales bacterium]
MGKYPTFEPSAESLLTILERLRAPGGCPWDREQTRQTLSRSLAEECAELLDAIDRNDPADICDELGDLFMNLLFQCVIAAEQGEFTYRDMAGHIIEKMVRRHAHIFGDEEAQTPEEVSALWTKIKEQEKIASGKARESSILDAVGLYLSSLDRAEKLQKKVAKVGFDWSNAQGIVEKIEEELSELKTALANHDETHIDEELGDLLFAVSNLSRFRKRATSEELLRAANRKFESRFRYIERRLKEKNISLEQAGIEQLEALWQEAKHAQVKADC